MKTEIYICAEVAGVRALYGDLFTPEFARSPIADQLDAQAGRLRQSHQQGDTRGAPQISSWFPSLIGAKSDEILAASFSIADARKTLAREYGFGGWEEAAAKGKAPPEARFENAVEMLLAGDADALADALREDGALASRRSRYGHGAGLLHYAAANGVETRRQVTPLNLPALIELLLNNGADPNMEASIYGGARPLGLLTTSAHPLRAGVVDPCARILRERGAN